MSKERDLLEKFCNSAWIYSDWLLLKAEVETLLAQSKREPVVLNTKDTEMNIHQLCFATLVELRDLKKRLPPKREFIDLDQVDKHLKTCDLSEDYRDGYSDGIIFAEREHKIRGKYE